MPRLNLTEEHKKKIGLANKGKKRSLKIRKMMSIVRKGTTPWNKGKTGVQEPYWLGKKRPDMTGSKSKWWKGDKVKYRGLHMWVSSILGVPLKCENKNCFYPRKNQNGIVYKNPKGFEWANKSGEYKRNKKDWVRLCVICHKIYDINALSFKINGEKIIIRL